VRSWFRSASPARLALPALIALLGVTGYLVSAATIRNDREAAAARRVQVESVRAGGVLGRARAYVAGLASVLAGEARPSRQAFARLAGSTAGSIGLVDAMWVESVPGPARARYERRLGSPLTRLTPSGRFVGAAPAASYLVAAFTSQTRPELRSRSQRDTDRGASERVMGAEVSAGLPDELAKPGGVSSLCGRGGRDHLRLRRGLGLHLGVDAAREAEDERDLEHDQHEHQHVGERRKESQAEAQRTSSGEAKRKPTPRTVWM